MNENFVNGEKYDILMKDIKNVNNAMLKLAESFSTSMNDLAKSLQDISSRYGVTEEEQSDPEEKKIKLYYDKVLAFKKKFDPIWPVVGYSIYYNESLNLYEYMKTCSPIRIKFATADEAAKYCDWLNGTNKDRLKLAEDIIGGVYHSIINNAKIEIDTKYGNPVYGGVVLFDDEEFDKIKRFLQIKDED